LVIHARRESGFFSGPEPRLFAHRGASARSPENTLESFRLARKAGAPYLELDVHLSVDGQVVVIHDNSVSRTTGRRGRVERMTLAEIRRLDAGHEFTLDRGRSFPYRAQGLLIPTLEEVLEEFPEARIAIELGRELGLQEDELSDIYLADYMGSAPPSGLSNGPKGTSAYTPGRGVP